MSNNCHDDGGSKHLCNVSKLHGAKTQKTVIFILATVRTSNLTSHSLLLHFSHNLLLLGAFATTSVKLRLLASSSLSARLSVSNSLRTAERIFVKFDIGLLKFVYKLQFWLKWDCNNGHFTWRCTCVSMHENDWVYRILRLPCYHPDNSDVMDAIHKVKGQILANAPELSCCV
jgi:hypothetical protein